MITLTTEKYAQKTQYIVWLDKVGRNVSNYDDAKKLYDKWVSLNYENVRLEIITLTPMWLC